MVGGLSGSGCAERLSAACPSTSFTMGNLGSKLESWLLANPEYAGRRLGPALDMARLEWAQIEAFDNATAKVLGPENLLELGPDFRAGLQPFDTPCYTARRFSWRFFLRLFQQ